MYLVLLTASAPKVGYSPCLVTNAGAGIQIVNGVYNDSLRQRIEDSKYRIGVVAVGQGTEELEASFDCLLNKPNDVGFAAIEEFDDYVGFRLRGTFCFEDVERREFNGKHCDGYLGLPNVIYKEASRTYRMSADTPCKCNRRCKTDIWIFSEEFVKDTEERIPCVCFEFDMFGVEKNPRLVANSIIFSGNSRFGGTAADDYCDKYSCTRLEESDKKSTGETQPNMRPTHFEP